MAAATSRPSWRLRLGGHVQLFVRVSLVIGLVDVRAAALCRSCLCVEAAASRTMVGNSFLG
jgi:hypothetical protein